MGGTKLMAVAAAAVTAKRIMAWAPRVIPSIPYGGTLARIRGRPAGSERPSLRVGEQRSLGRGGGRPTTTFRLLLPRGFSGPLAPGTRPAFLMGDLVTLLDHEEIHEAGQRIRQELEVVLPVARRIGEGLHLIDGETQRGPIAFARGELELLQDPRAADARGTGHATPSSRRTMRAASTMERSLATPTQRGVSQSPQSGTSQSRSAGTCWRASLTRSTISAGVSTWKAFTSTTPTATSLSVGNSLHNSSSLISRFAYSKTNWLTCASRSRGYRAR